MISLKYISPPSHLTRFLSSDGNLYFDLDEGFNLRMTKVLEQLTDTAKITQQAALTTTIARTIKNETILDGFEVNAISQIIQTIPVEVRKDEEILPINRLSVISFEDAENRISIELYGSGWIDDLEALKISSLNLGTFEYTLANVLASWANRSALAVPSVADYGKWLTPGDVTRKDLRFKYNVWELLKIAFCEIGWTVESPFFESEGGRYIFAYLSPEDWHTYPGKGTPNAAFLNVATDKDFIGTGVYDVIFDEIADPANNYDALGVYTYPTGEVPTTIFFDFRGIEIFVDTDTLVGFFTLNLHIYIERNRNGEITEFDGFRITNLSVIGEYRNTVNFQIIDYTNQPGDTYKVKAYFLESFGIFPGTGRLHLLSGELDIIPETPYYIEDDIIPLASLINPDLNGLDLFKSMVHLCNGKIATTEANKTVTIYPPFKVAHVNTLVDGFFVRDSSTEDLTQIIRPKSRSVNIKTQEQERFIDIKFKDASDAYIKERFPDNDPYKKRIDLGFGISKPKEIKNPLFEPSIEREQEIADVGGFGLSGIRLPVHWDNTSGASSTNIGVRIGYNYGLVDQFDSVSIGAIQWRFEGVDRTSIGYITQEPTISFSGGGLVVPLVFADYANDLFKFYKKWVVENFGKFEVQFLANIDLDKYLSLDFRIPIIINYGESYIKYQLTAIQDFSVSENITTPIDLTPIIC